MLVLVEADALRSAEGTTMALPIAEAPSLHRGQRAGHASKDSPGTWEIWTSPFLPVGRPETKAHAPRRCGVWRNEVPPSEGDRAANAA